MAKTRKQRLVEQRNYGGLEGYFANTGEQPSSDVEEEMLERAEADEIYRTKGIVSVKEESAAEEPVVETPERVYRVLKDYHPEDIRDSCGVAPARLNNWWRKRNAGIELKGNSRLTVDTICTAMRDLEVWRKSKTMETLEEYTSRMYPDLLDE